MALEEKGFNQTNNNTWICCLFMFAGGVCGGWWVGKDWLWAWLPCVMHPAMACAEKPVPYLQGNCLVLAFMVRGLSLFRHFSLLTHCGGGLLFSNRGCTPALFVPACVQAGCCLWFQDTSWMSSVQLCILLVVPSSIVLVSIVPPSGKYRDIDVSIEL